MQFRARARLRIRPYPDCAVKPALKRSLCVFTEGDRAQEDFDEGRGPYLAPAPELRIV